MVVPPPAVPLAYAETGQLAHVGPPAGHVELREVVDVCEEFWLRHGPPERSLKYRTPPRPSRPIQYGPDVIVAEVTDTAFHAPALIEDSVPEVSSEPGFPLRFE